MTTVAADQTAGPDAPRSGTVEAEVARLRQTFASGRTRDLGWRIRQLAGIERLLTEREDEIAAVLAADLGRSAHYAWLGDIASSKAEAEFARKHLRGWARKRRTRLPLALQPGRAFYQYEPLGVVLVIGPWNYPVYLTLGPLVGAIAAGNCVVVKPSEHAPASSALLASLLPQYVDPDAISVLEGEAGVSQELLAQGLDHVLFTGGPEIGKKVMAAAAPHLTPVTLELGGKSPVIIAADGNVAVAARRVAWTKLLNSGQTCIAPDYVLVDEQVCDQFLTELTATVAEFQQGEPAAQRIVNARQLDRIAGLLDSAGGRVVLGGGVDRAAQAIEPTVIVGPDVAAPLMTEEIFGPVLPVVPVPSVQAAIDFINARPKPLALYLFSGSAAVKEQVLTSTSSGGAVINHLTMHCLVPQLPFGGVGNSGMGAYHGEWGFQTFSHRKAVLSKPAKPDPSVLYPPYTEVKKRFMRRFF
jgi:aldehyde dehydrogenase (NAD+)